MRISRFDGFADNRPRHEDHTWESFCREVIGEKHRPLHGDKSHAPCFSPAEFAEGAPRQAAYVRAIHLAVFDFDDLGPAQLDELRGCAAQYRSVLYTSPSHGTNGPDDIRARLVFDLTRPVPSFEWGTFWPRLAGALPVAPDPVCHDPGRLYALPFAARPELAFIERNDAGPALDADQVLALPLSAGLPAVRDADLEATQPITVQHLRELVARLKKITRGPRALEARDRARWFEQLANGEPFAIEGTRHGTYLRLTAYLEREFPKAPCESIADLFALSLRAMASGDFDPAAEQAEVLRATRGARDKRLADEAARAAFVQANQEQAIREAFAPLGLERTQHYTHEEINAYAEVAGTTPEAFRKRLIVVHGSSAYLFVGGAYRPPVAGQNLLVAATRDLAPAMDVGVSLTKVSATTGATVRKTRDEILSDYGTAAAHAVASFAVGRSYYDARTQTFYEAVCPPRNLTPAHSERVDRWLQLLAGNRYADLCLWLQELPDLTKPLAALYLEGPGGVGKSLLAQGVARIWTTHGITRAADATDGFNDTLPGCPAVFADEVMPPAWLGPGGLGRFREFVATSQRTLNRKNLARVPLLGCLRVVLAANNLDLVEARLQLTPSDRAAILERIFHVEIPGTHARRYLEGLGDAWGAFVEGDELAKHVLYLAQAKAYERAGRFGVAPRETKLSDEMRAAHPVNSGVGQWLIHWLLDKSRPVRPGLAMVMVKDGAVWANAQGLQGQNDWGRYVSNPKDVPPPRLIGKALSELAGGLRRQHKGFNYWVIGPDHLQVIAEQFDLTPAAIELALKDRAA